jgi:hypothetical protein
MILVNHFLKMCLTLSNRESINNMKISRFDSKMRTPKQFPETFENFTKNHITIKMSHIFSYF